MVKSPSVPLRILLPAMLACLGLLTMASFLGIQLVRARAETLKLLDSEIRASGTELQRDLDRLARRGEFDGMGGSIAYAGIHPLSAGVALVGNDGKIREACRLEIIGMTPREAFPEAIFPDESSEWTHSLVAGAPGSNILTGLFKVDLDGTDRAESRGWLIYNLDASHPIAVARANAWQWFRTLTLLTLLFVILLGVAMNLLIARRLESLGGTVRQIAAGDLRVRPAVSGQDEIGQLSRGLSSMIDRLEAASAERDRSNQMMGLQNESLAGIAEDKPLLEVLDHLCRQLELLHDRSLCSVMKLTEDDGLQIISGPGLGDEIRAKINGLAPGSRAGSCGTAVYTGKPVFVCDTETDPRWDALRDVARQLGIRSCWSVPIRDGDQIFGTFALTHLVMRDPTNKDRELLDSMARLASIAIRRDRTQRELRDSEHHFRTLADSGPSLIWVSNADGRRTYVNRLWEEFVGGVTRNGSSEGGRKGIHPADVEDCLGNRYRALLSRERYGVDYRLRRQDGEYRWIHEEGVPRFNSRREFTGYIGHCLDVTARMKAEEQLRESESRLRLAVGSANIGLWDWNLRTNDIIFSREWRAQLGYDDTEVRDHFDGFLALLHPDDRERALSIVNKAISDPEFQYENEFRLRHNDGSWRWIDSRGEVILDENRQAVRMIGCHLDVTDRKNTEARLSENELRLRQMAEASDMVFWLTSATEESVLYVSPAFETIWGRKAQDLYAHPRLWVESIHPDEAGRVGRMFGEFIGESRADFDIEFRVVRADGSVRWIHDQGRMIRDDKGRPHRVAGVARDITNQKLAEQSLRDSEERFRAVFKSVPNGLVAADADGKIVLVNDRITEWFGYSREELIGRPVERLMPERYRWNHVRDRVDFMASPEVRPMGQGRILYGLRKNGEEFPIEIGLAPILSGSAPLVLAAIMDVTDRQRAETALRESENRYRTVINQVVDPLFITDLQGRFIDVNKVACEVLGYRREELLEMSILDVNANLTGETLKLAIEEWVQKPEEMSVFETRHRRRDGSEFSVEMRVGAVKLGDQLRLVGVAHDLTRRKAIEEEVRALNSDLERRVEERTNELSRLASILDASPDLIGIATLGGPEHEVSYANVAMKRLYASRNLDAERIKIDLFHPASSVKRVMEEGFPKAIRDRIWISETEVYGPGESVIPVSQLIQSHRDSAGEIKFVSTVMRDISDRKRMEDELRHRRDALLVANGELAKASRLKDEFLASMSHELRTPLNGVLAVSEALQESIYGPVNDQQIAALRDIEQCGRHLLSLINDILDLSKVESGQIVLEREPVEVDSLCQSAVRLVREMAQKKKLRVTLSVDGALGLVFADARRMKQILVNLLGNAVKFTPEGGSVSLTVTGDPDRRAALFAVSDTGIGIREEDIKLLFRPFQQIDSRLSREYAGTGLGLALVRRMAELHGGSVSVVSRPGHGSCFTVALPWEVADDSFEAAESRSSMVRKALLIEDSPGDAMKLERYLSDLNVETVVHPGFVGAIDRIRAERPEVVLLDLLLPDGDGWGILNELKADADLSRTPVIVVSMLDDRNRCLALGAEAHLVKPVDRETLRLTLMRLASPVGRDELAPAVPSITASASAPMLLVAEDNPINARIIRDYLVTAGYAVEVVGNGLQAVERARELLPAMILIDIQMPGMDGLEAIGRLRSEEPTRSIPIAAVTALAMPGDRERCLAAGANEYLMKPVSLKLLRELVERYVRTPG